MSLELKINTSKGSKLWLVSKVNELIKSRL